MRNLHEVLTEIVSISSSIPELKIFTERCDEILRDIQYTAPECTSQYWNKAQGLINLFIRGNIDTIAKVNIVNIWTDLRK